MLRPDPIGPIPTETVRISRAAFPKGNLYLQLRDELGVLYSDADFASLFPTKGQPALPAWRLALVTVFQFLENLTDRQAADQVRARLDWKYALGLELEHAGFDFSVLSEFRSRLLAGSAEQVLLDKMLERFKTRGYLRLRGRQRTDSTHILGAIRNLNRLELIGETFRAALNAVATENPEWLRPRIHPRWVEWYDHRVEERRLPKGVEAREQRAIQIGLDGFELLDSLKDEGDDTLRTLPAVLHLKQVWEQQFSSDSQSGEVKWLPPGAAPPSSERSASPYDPETHFCQKRDTTWVGYKVHMTETCDPDLPGLITHVLVTNATLADIRAVPLVHSALEKKQLLPDRHLMDAGYTSIEIMQATRSQYNVEMVGPTHQSSSWQDGTPEAYGVDRFRIDWEKKEVYCPQNFLSRSWYELVNKQGASFIRVEWNQRTCERCPVRSLCTTATRAGRSLTLKPRVHHEALIQARKQETAQDWKQLYAQRQGIEATLSQGVRRFDLRQARYWGEAKMRLQALSTAAALNLTRWNAWLQGIPRGPTRIARFAQLVITA